jgi:Tol biopolymer transport system component
MPDGKGFAYISDSMGSWALVRSLAGSPSAAVSIVAGSNVVTSPASPAVSPDGKRIAFSVKVRDAWTVAVVHTDGTQLTMMGPGWDPQWSPDGKRIVFIRDVNNVHQMFTVDASTGADLTQLSGPSGASSGNPAYSPDGSYIVFASTANGDASQPTNLFAIKPDGTGLTQLTQTQGECLYPFWSKTGQLFFSADPTKSGRHDLYRLQLPPELTGGTGAVASSQQ